MHIDWQSFWIFVALFMVPALLIMLANGLLFRFDVIVSAVSGFIGVSMWAIAIQLDGAYKRWQTSLALAGLFFILAPQVLGPMIFPT